MGTVALVKILSKDAVGLVAAIADRLFTAGVNLRDTTYAALGGGGGFTALCELPDGLTASDLGAALALLPALAGADIEVIPYAFDPAHGPQGRITHWITMTGGDQLGLIARLAEIFAQYHANIVRLDTQTLPDGEGSLYVTRFAVSLAPDVAATCLSTVVNTAGSLRLSCRIDDHAPARLTD